MYAVVATAAHVQDGLQAHRRLHGQEAEVFADAGYKGVDIRPESQGRPVTRHVAMKRAKRRALDKSTSFGWVMDAFVETFAHAP